MARPEDVVVRLYDSSGETFLGAYKVPALENGSFPEAIRLKDNIFVCCHEAIEDSMFSYRMVFVSTITEGNGISVSLREIPEG